MNRTKRMGRLGGLAASAAAATPFAWLWVLQVNNARDPLTAQVRLDMAIWMAVFGTPWMVAAWLAEYPSYHRAHPAATAVSLPPVTAVVLAVVLAGCLWLALRPPHWLLPDRHARRFGIGMALVLAAGFLLASRRELRDLPGDAGIMNYLLNGPILWVLTGSAAAAAVGRSFRSGLRACAWATVLAAPLLVAAWLAEALHWHQQGRGLLLDGAGGLGVGANLGDAIWWPLVFLALWAVPLGVLGAAAGSWWARRRRAREHSEATI